MIERKYYKGLKNVIKEIVNKIRNAHISLNKGFMCVFLFVARNGQVRCRSPPFINLIKKIQIDRRKERWQNALKEENIRIILIH